MLDEIQKEMRRKMKHTLEVVVEELAAVRTGRASGDLLNTVMVDYYGTLTPLPQLATVNAPDSQLLLVTPYDPSSVKAIEKAINGAGMGLNSTADGSSIRVPIPILTEERRKEMVKHVRKLGEDGRVAVRNLRRDSNEQIKKLEKEKEVSQDEARDAMDAVQKDTDGHIKKLDELIKQKETDLMTV